MQTLTTKKANNSNKILDIDKSFHSWYRFVLSFPPHLVREYINRFKLDNSNIVLDPFCGTGTTLVECKKMGIPSIGIEAHPMAHFAASVKINWEIDPINLINSSEIIAEKVIEELRCQGIEDEPFFHINVINNQNLISLPSEQFRLLIKDSISPIPLHKTLTLLQHLKNQDNTKIYNYQLLALAKALVSNIGNVRFGPEVGIGKIKEDTPVVLYWLSEIKKIARDIQNNDIHLSGKSQVILSDARNLNNQIEEESISAVITSPPYPNEKDYTRTTRLESVILGFVRSKNDLRNLKKNLVRSNTRGIYSSDDDDKWISDNITVQGIAREIEKRRIKLGKTSGFEKNYHRVAKLYFGGMFRHLSVLRNFLKRGAKLAYVVGDQESYLRVNIPTGHILADMSQSLGYEVLGLDVFRKRFSTSSKKWLNEEVLLLEWNH
ncbi:MAG: DNA methyltransferase [Candidatus Marinimicrobia bacterium]|nr:DNA methyltransferase [Candidatus Neomarinimicrobiota bacterium]